MKKFSRTFNKFIVTIFAVLFSVIPIFAQEENFEEPKEKSRWTLSITTDFAYYFESNPNAGGTHFAPLTGPYSGLEARTTFNAAYKIPTPLGEHWLVKNASVTVNGSFELSPLTIKPMASVAFELVPFLIFSTGGSAGTGWPLLGMQGLGVINDELEYDNLTPFKNWCLEFWGKALFQFDTGAIWKGDWTHVLMQASITFSYFAVTGIDNNDLWLWQNSMNYCSGWRYTANFVLGYQLPFKVNMVGVMLDMIGQMNPSDYGRFNNNYNGGFDEINISPVVRINFREQDFMFILIRFKSRRSFEQNYSDKYEMLNLDYAGREWFFDRIAFSWTHLF